MNSKRHKCEFGK